MCVCLCVCAHVCGHLQKPAACARPPGGFKSPSMGLELHSSPLEEPQVLVTVEGPLSLFVLLHQDPEKEAVTSRCLAACWELMFSPFVVSTKTCPLSLLFAGLFLQQCHFLRQAGHSEKVISLFQAMVDFTFFKPDSVKELPTKVQVWCTLCLRSIPP